MSDYVGQPPHGGVKITHHELCLGDCGHWDCMGCCYCPEESDVEVVETLTATKDAEWLAWWFSDQIEQAELRGIQKGVAEGVKTGRSGARTDMRTAILEYYKVAPKAAEPLLRILDEEVPQ